MPMSSSVLIPRGDARRPAIRVVSLAKRTEAYYDLTERGMLNEAEMIDFYQGESYYSDADGNLYSVEF